MQAVWSFWSKPAAAGRSGWGSELHHWLSWVLSVETCRRFFGRICLVTDQAGARLLVDGLGLAFDVVTTPLDALHGSDPGLWALGKLHAYQAQDRPFLHIDSDVYFWDAMPSAWLQAPVCAAYPEWVPYGNNIYRCASLKWQLRSTGGWLPEELDAFVPHGGMLRAENCGVVGGQRADFLSFYAGRTIAMLDHPANQAAWRRRQPIAEDMVIFEQHMLSACLDYHAARADGPYAGIRVQYLFDDWGAAARDRGRAGFTHLVAGTKRNPEVLARLQARVAADYPVLYERCLAMAE